MQAKFVQRLLYIGVVLSVIGISFAGLAVMRVMAQPANNARVSLEGHSVPLLRQAQFVRSTDTKQQLNLSIGLTPRNSTALDTLLQAIYNPQSPHYHRYLSPDQFNRLFAPTPEQVQQVVNFLHSQGLTVKNVAPNNLLIDATGSVAQAQQAFTVQINTYKRGTQTFYANSASPSVPAAVAQLVTSINGLDNSTQYHPYYRRFVHASTTPTGYGASSLTGAYNIAPLQNTGVLGDNQTIALFELDGYQLSDVQQYIQYYNIGSMPKITNVLVNGFNGAAGQGAAEDELDIEVAAAMAPHANQIVYEGPNTTQGINATYNKIVTDNKAKIVTISWGLCESVSGNAELKTLDTIFKQGAAQGMSFFAASGDAGAYDCQDTNLGVSSPASDPYVMAVGGTSLQLDAGGAYSSEAVWSNPKDNLHGPMGAGGGGGISATFKQPDWQKGDGVQNLYSNGNRQIPDVSAVANPSPGYAVYCTVKNAGCPSSGWISIGGTSGGAPLWAGSMALVNQYLHAHKVASIGAANSTLYGLFNAQQAYPAFHDVTLGTNLFYPATTGYDLASGIGTPNVYNIALDLVSGSSSA